MLGESLFIYNLTQKVGEFFVGDYKKELIKERNKESGIHETIQRIKSAEPINLNPTFAEIHTIQVSFSPTDSLYVLFGSEPVYLTPKEMRYIEAIEDWKAPHTAGVLRYIVMQQDLRSEVYT